jgi:phosphoribosylformimino-5-aminoimidazole carboxamide ribotide isomerase
MILIPAIDLKEGRCVRLRQGRMEDDTVFSEDPVSVATQWVEQGARRLHLVDLDGAFAGAPRNAEIVTAICRAFPQLPVQIGGGIRSDAIADAYIAAGVQWVIIGTLAVKQPEFVKRLCRRLPGKVIVGLDARNGMVATEGWADASEHNAIDVARGFEDAGVAAIVYTDIARDGMMQGVNVAATSELATQISIPVIASGGMSSPADIDALLQAQGTPISGVIIGRALYEGTIDLVAAQQQVSAYTASTH